MLTLKQFTEDNLDEPPLKQAVATEAVEIFKHHHDDWQWQIGNRIRNLSQLLTHFPSLGSPTQVAEVIKKYPMSITPYYASLIKKLDYSDPVFAMAVPQINELVDPAYLKEDPLEETKDMPVPGLVHRYQDRALLITTTRCSMYCRHCTRKRVAGTREEFISPRRLRQVVEYISAHPEIKDVIISGGDPLTMNDSALEKVISALRQIPSVEVIRIGSRVPVVMPQRITDDLVKMLSKYHPIWINTHFNHPNEITPQSKQACEKIANAGIPLGNQSVLLRGVNDSPMIMEELCRSLVRMRVRPYYLFQCDLVKGVEHFRTNISKGLEIMEYLRGRLSGIAIPTYVVDSPYGGGKIPLLPNYIVSVSPTHTVIRNFEGMFISYPEPNIPYHENVCVHSDNTISSLARGGAQCIRPDHSSRFERRLEIHTENNNEY